MNKTLLHGLTLLSAALLWSMDPTPSVAQPGAIDPTFNPSDIGFGNGDGAGSSVSSTAVQPDGKIIIGGFFTSYNNTTRNRIARLNADGSLDVGFNPGTGATGTGDNSVRSIALQPNGKIIIGGGFNLYNGLGSPRIARLNADGSRDTGFNPGAGAGGLNAAVLSIWLQPDGKIIIGGTFTSYNGTARNRIARLNADGSLDASFDPGTGANDIVQSISLQPDGKIIIAGVFTSYNGTARNRIARLNTDGSLDAGFNPDMGADDLVRSIALQPNGKIIIGGAFTNYNGTAYNGIARLNTDGSLDVGFDPGMGTNGLVQSVALQPDGKIIIGGAFTNYNGTARNRIVRLNADGGLDASFNPGSGANNSITSTTLQPDGNIIIAGGLTNYNGTPRNRIARLNADGSLDAGFNPGMGTNGSDFQFKTVYNTAMQPDGKIIMVGIFNSYNDVARNSIARLHTDGSLDTSFDPGIGANAVVWSIALQPDGKTVIGGAFTSYNGTALNRIVRLNTDGSLDTGFNPGTGANGTVVSMALQPDGKIIIGGSFTNYNGTARNRIARLNADGSLDADFNPGTGANGTIEFTALQPDGKIIIGGGFTSYNGTVRNHIARLNADGSLDAGFNPGEGANFSVSSIALQPDGKIIIGGGFTNYNGTVRNRIARLNADGSLDADFSPGTGANDDVLSTALQPDGKILIGGRFFSYNGTGQNRIARLNADGSLDTGFTPGEGANDWVWSIQLQPDGKIIIGGDFTSYNGTGRNRIARLLGGEPPSIDLNALQINSICTPDAFLIPCTATGTFNPGNTFTAQLSNATGSFASPTVIGSLQATTSGQIPVTIGNVPFGTAYRIRVVSSDPVVIGTNNPNDLSIAPSVDATWTFNTSVLCTNAGIVLPTVATPGGVWSTPFPGLALDPVTGAINTGLSTPGQYQLSYTVGQGACEQTEPDGLSIIAAPSATISYAPNTLCIASGGLAQPLLIGTTGGSYTSSPAGLSINATTGTIDIAASTPGSYTVTYAIPATANCSASTTTTNVTLLPDTDGDGVCDPDDNCPNNPGQIGSPCSDGDPCTAGDLLDAQCNCVGTPLPDSDGDGTCDAQDGCPDDPLKTAPGTCGCGVPDTDTDGDGTADCIDGCPADPLKITAGACGCGTPDVPTLWYADADGDGFGNPNNALAGFTCLQPPGRVANNTDCNDANPTINPAAAEVWNCVDDNCNGQTDEGFSANPTPSEGDYRTAGSGNWGTTAIWQRYNGTAYVAAPTPPGAGDGVIVVRDGHTVSITDVREADQVVVETCGSLQLQGGQLSVANGPNEDVLVLGSFQLNGGSLFGPGDITVSASGSFIWTGGGVRTTAVLNLAQGSNSVFGFGGIGFLGNSGTINNAGTFTITSGRLIIGEAGPGAFNNLSTGVLNFNGANNSENSWEQNTTNHGVINKNIAAPFGMHGTFVNNGTVNVATDELYIGANTTNNGTMAFAGSGTTLRTAGTFTNTATGVISNAATLRVSGGTFTSESGASITGVDFLDLAGTTTLASGSTCTAPTAISVQGEFHYAMPFTVNALSLFGNGQLRGPGAITIPSGSSFTWTGGNVQVNAVLHLEQGSNSVLNFGGFGFVGNNGTINNAGTFTMANGRVIIGEGPGAFNNLPTGVLNFNGTSNTENSWQQNTTNDGVINKNIAAPFGVHGTFVNNSTVNVAASVLHFGATTTNNGTMTFAGAGTTLSTGGNFTNTATGVITSPATLRVGGGTFTSQSGGSISGVDFLDIVGLAFLESGSTCTSPNTITVSSGQLNHAMPFTVNALNLIGSGQLRGPGAITVSSGGGFTWTGGNVMPNAILNLEQGSNSVFSFGGFGFLGNNGTINNAGTFTRSVGQLIIGEPGPGAFNNLPTGVLIFNGGGFWSQRITNQGVIQNNLSGNFDINEHFNNLPGGLVNVNSGSLTIGGPQTMAGRFLVAAGAVLNSGQPFNFTGTEVENNGSITVQNLRFQGSDAQQLTGTGSIANMTLNGSGGVDLGGTQTITGTLTLTNGNLRLGANDLVLSNTAAGAISGGSASSHVVTNGSGSLRRPVSGAGYVFPVGTAGSYTPATLSLTAGPSEEFRARVQTGVSTEYAAPGSADGSSVTNDVVGRTWVIEEITPGGNAASITFQWNADDEGPGFDRTNSLVAAYDGSNWVSGTAGPASGSGPYSRQTTGVIAFREFAVSDADAELNAAPTIALALRMVLEGPYDPATGLMYDALRTLPSFPLTEPYTDLGYDFVGGGGETVSPAQLAVIGPDAIVDWVVVEVRDAVTGIPVMASRSALLQRDGDVVDVDGTPSLGFNLPPGLYQVAVLHRNHLATMTKVPVALGALTPVDFTLITMETFGIQGQKHVSGTFPLQALWAGDVTFDGVIKYTGENNDRDPVLTAIGGIVPTATITGYHGTDVNMDGTVKYTGEDNDRDPILQNIGGVVPTNVRVEQVP